MRIGTHIVSIPGFFDIIARIIGKKALFLPFHHACRVHDRADRVHTRLRRVSDRSRREIDSTHREKSTYILMNITLVKKTWATKYGCNDGISVFIALS